MLKLKEMEGGDDGESVAHSEGKEWKLCRLISNSHQRRVRGWNVNYAYGEKGDDRLIQTLLGSRFF